LAEPHRRGIDLVAARHGGAHPLARLPRIERKIPQPLRRGAGPRPVIDLARGRDALRSDLSALAFVDMPDRTGHDQGAATGFGTGAVGVDRVVAGLAQPLDDRIADVERHRPSDRGGALARRHAGRAPVEREAKARVEGDRGLIERKVADDDRIGAPQPAALLGAGRRSETDQDGETGSEMQSHRVPPEQLM
jgi:hypothetical protein